MPPPPPKQRVPIRPRSPLYLIRATTAPTQPNKDYRNEGHSTPLATLQTFAWACDRGDTAAVEKLLCFEDEARNKAMAFMDSLPAKVRSQWNSPEAMATTMLTAQSINLPFPAARILATATVVPVNVDRVTLQLPDTTLKSTEYQKTGDGWKYLITEAMVDDYVNRSRQAAAAGR